MDHEVVNQLIREKFGAAISCSWVNFYLCCSDSLEMLLGVC